MLFWLFEQAHRATWHGGGGLPTNITLRTLLAALCSFVLAVVLGPQLIGWLRARYREPIVSDCKQLERLQSHKQWTPTMGGLFITAGIVAATLLLGDLQNPYVPAAVILVLGLCLVGYCDDRLKVAFGHGLRARSKLAAQSAVATLVALPVYFVHRDIAGGLDLVIPWTAVTLPLGIWFVPLAILIILGSSNAVNLTDGLDGLACGCLIFALAAIGGMVYVAGHAEWSAIVARQELLLIMVAGVFVAEALSVILQVGYYRWRRRRIFRCAPLHHHFQLAGWSENKIVVRFWIASALCAILSLAALKGSQDPQPVAPSAPAQSASSR
jgi:phospho-N-acetylmuramoyl-pentapeptide-transferase